MKNLKSILALALSLSMCVSLVACGSSADEDDEDKAEKKAPTSSAAAAEKEPDEKTESKAEAEESTAESKADESESVDESEDESEDDTGASVFTNDISFTEIEPFISDIAGKDIDTAEKILKDTFDITSERKDEEAGVPLEGYVFHEWDISDDLVICGINISEISITTVNGIVENIAFLKEYEEGDIESILEDGHIISEELKNIGYDTVSPTYGGDQLIAEFSTNCGTVDIPYSTDWVELFVSDLH